MTTTKTLKLKQLNGTFILLFIPVTHVKIFSVYKRPTVCTQPAPDAVPVYNIELSFSHIKMEKKSVGEP